MLGYKTTYIRVSTRERPLVTELTETIVMSH